MNNIIEPKLDLPVGAIPPDIFYESSDNIPTDSFIVSRNRDGSVASTYGETSWNLTAYHPEGKPSFLYFVYWDSGDTTQTRKILMSESRLILFSLMWLRNGPSLSIGTLRNYLTVVKELARYSEKNLCRIKDLLSDEKKLWIFVESQNSGWLIQALGSMLPHLTNIKHGFMNVGDKFLQAIRTRGMQYRDTLLQHPPIPTRIYSSIIDQLTESIFEWESVAEDMLRIVKTCKENPLAGRDITHQCNRARKLGILRKKHLTFTQLASENSLEYISKKGLNPNVKSLSTLIAEIQLVTKLTIQAFTGMRDDEALSLPYNCLQTNTSNGINHYIILGRTTKLNNGHVKRTRWVTNIEGYRAVKVAQKIAEAIFAVFHINIESISTHTNKYPLFVSVGYLGFAGTMLSPKEGRFRPSKIDLTRMSRLRSRLQPIIEDDDIRELEQIDPHRAWRSEERFQLGEAWLFTSHQLRRSLALYAQRSGLVSLPSLRRQLQHVTNEMSLYYAKGSTYAKNFIGSDKSHFGVLWQETKSESAGLSYILNVLLSEDIVFGGHASWIKNKLRENDECVSFDREETLRQFKKGEIAYKETLLGGCVSTEPCKQSGLKWINTECLENGCKNLVCSLPKLERVIIAQEKLVNSLDKNLVEYRTEKTDLEILISARDKALKINLNHC